MNEMKIKLCGITRDEDFLEASRLGLDYVGFIFVPGSKRYVTPSLVRLITRGADRNHTPLKVGVFADEEIETVQEVFNSADLDVVQLHGSESKEYCNALGLPFWKVLTSTRQITEYADINDGPVLLDASGAYERENTSPVIERGIVETALSSGRKILIAGGLSVNNIHNFLELNPWGFDFCSSVEESPGIKSEALLCEIVERIRGYKYEN